MSTARTDPHLRLRTLDHAPERWDRFLQRVPAAELAASSHWTELAARHYGGASPCWVVAETQQDGLVGGLPLLRQRRLGLMRLESSFDGSVAGPQVAADLPAPMQDLVFATLCRHLATLVKGRTALAALTVADADARRRLSRLPLASRWTVHAFQSAVVDCRPGLARIEAEAFTKNRRNERNRGLRRGCTLHCERDPAALVPWYRIYLTQARHWAQAPVPLGFLEGLMRFDPSRAFLNTVRLDGEVLGGHFCLISRQRLVPFLSGALSAMLRSHFLNTLLYWQDLSLACETGLEAVDFGGSVGRDTLWDFKRRCGGVPEERLQLQIRSRVGRCIQSVSVIRRRLHEARR